jgi:CDP-diacylglycerol--serine O-phosphatidyltransferase
VFSGAVLVGVALLCVSTLPVWSFKNFKVPTANVLPMLLGVVVFAAVLLADPYAAGALLGIAYIAMLPFSRRSYKRLAREAETRRTMEAEA